MTRKRDFNERGFFFFFGNGVVAIWTLKKNSDVS